MICHYCGKEIEKGTELNLLVKANCCSEECKAKIHDEVVKAVNGGRNSKEKKHRMKRMKRGKQIFMKKFLHLPKDREMKLKKKRK